MYTFKKGKNCIKIVMVLRSSNDNHDSAIFFDCPSCRMVTLLSERPTTHCYRNDVKCTYFFGTPGIYTTRILLTSLYFRKKFCQKLKPIFWRR
jgi:hypothetical protein